MAGFLLVFVRKETLVLSLGCSGLAMKRFLAVVNLFNGQAFYQARTKG